MNFLKIIPNLNENAMTFAMIAMIGVYGLMEVKGEYAGKQEIQKPVVSISNVVTGPNSYVLRWDVSNIPSNAVHVVYNVWRCRYTEEKTTETDFCGEVVDDTKLDVTGWFLDRNTYWRVTVSKVVF